MVVLAPIRMLPAVRERVVQVGVDGEDTVCVVEHQLAVCGKGDVSPASVEQGDT